MTHTTADFLSAAGRPGAGGGFDSANAESAAAMHRAAAGGKMPCHALRHALRGLDHAHYGPRLWEEPTDRSHHVRP